MKSRNTRFAVLLFALLLLSCFSLPALATPPGGVPPGQAKKMAPGNAGKGHGPPDHAPAHGYRAKHEYRYFPNHNVYYDPERTLFFFEREGHWVSAPEPPPLLEIDLGGGVTLELDTDTPFKFNSEHRQRYP